MAKEAAKASDRVIITSDNPRFEEPQEIINDMLAGLDAEDMRKTLSIADRKEAIRTACMLAEKGDVILVAGKGHENYQEIKESLLKKGYTFASQTDTEVAAALLELDAEPGKPVAARLPENGEEL